MINRIRSLRKAKGWTLADLAHACEPPTTPQTIGRLETGTRNLSLQWMERIAGALGVSPDAIVTSDKTDKPKIVARLSASGTEALTSPTEAIMETELNKGGPLMVLSVETSVGEYRAGDQVWLRQVALSNAAHAVNRDVLVARPGGRFAFGRLIDRHGSLVGILPPGLGEKQVIVDAPPWIAVAEMLIRKL